MESLTNIKTSIFTAIGILGSIIAGLLGGWDTALQTLLILMVVDYVMGLIVAGVFQKSGKTETGGLQSNAGWKGLCKKGVTLLFVLVAYRLDILVGDVSILGIEVTVRIAVIIGYIVNELISIVENAGLMGFPVPAVIKKVIDVLAKQNQIDLEGDE